MLVPFGDFFGQLVLAMGIAMVPRPGLVPGIRITTCCIRGHNDAQLTTSNRVKTLFPLKTKVLYGPRFCIFGSCHPRFSNQLLGIRVPVLLRFIPPYFLPCFLLSWLDFWCHLNPWILLLPLPAITCCPGVQSDSGHFCPSTNCKLLA